MIPWRRSSKGADEIKRILVIQLGGLAAFMPALAAAKRIRDFHVGAHVTLLATEDVHELAEQCPYFDAVEADGQPKEPQAITKLIARIRAAKYDMVYDLEGSSRTANYFHGLRPWPPKWCGPVAGASHAYLAPDRMQRHPLDRYAEQLAVAGLAVEGAALLPDLSWVRTALRDPPRLKPEYFGLRGPYVVLLPRADAEPARCWPLDKYIELANRIARRGVTPVVLGSATERELGAAIAKAEPSAKNLVTRPDLFQRIALAERAAFAVGDDVEAMHVAVATGVPCLVFLSSLADPERVAPRGRGGVVAMRATVIADLPVEQVDAQLRNCGVYAQAASA